MPQWHCCGRNGGAKCVVEAFCIPVPICRYGSLIRDASSTTFHDYKPNDGFVFDEYSHLLAQLNQPWLSRDRLRHFAAIICEKGAPLENCWDFIDGRVRSLCKPDRNHRILYDGHKRVHGIKLQSVVAQNGRIACLFGPVESRRHDSGINKNLVFSNELIKVELPA